MTYPHQTFTSEHPMVVGSPTTNPPFEVKLTSTWQHIPVGITLWVTGSHARTLVEDLGHIELNPAAQDAAETPADGQRSGQPEREPIPEEVQDEASSEPLPDPSPSIPVNVPRPPTAGPGSSRLAWLQYAAEAGLTNLSDASRDEIINAVDSLLGGG